MVRSDSEEKRSHDTLLELIVATPNLFIATSLAEDLVQLPSSPTFQLSIQFYVTYYDDHNYDVH